jgi:hypothetical protein
VLISSLGGSGEGLSEGFFVKYRCNHNSTYPRDDDTQLGEITAKSTRFVKWWCNDQI